MSSVTLPIGFWPTSPASLPNFSRIRVCAGTGRTSGVTTWFVTRTELADDVAGTTVDLQFVSMTSRPHHAALVTLRGRPFGSLMVQL